ncbi:MAG: efflux RND transporter periplasmic adaptor subunit [Gammaproteobacteria bacterium]|nr:efflux RND transporter periplasmic adaptor subunit [Gammaproteobacteria bacterium]
MIELLKRHALSLLFAVGVLVLALFVFLRVQEVRAPDAARQGSGPTPVVVADVIRAPFLDTLQAVGTAAANESVEITASVSDRVESLTFREGELAEAGQVLVQLDTREEEAELAEALANLDDQRRQFERLDALVATNSAALSQRDEQKSRMDAAAARVEVIRARIADRTLRAPFSGLVGLREVSPGALVSPGARITTLDDLQPLKLDFSIPESFLTILRPGAVIRARTIAYPGQVFEGRVAHISPRIDPVTRSVAIRAELPNEDRLLRPGMLLTLDLVRDRRQGLMVPEAALIPEGDRQYLYRLVDGTVERIEVGIGARRPGIVEITRGLEEGDRVVVEGALRLRPGVEVRIQREIDARTLIAEEDRQALRLPTDADPAVAGEGRGSGEIGG